MQITKISNDYGNSHNSVAFKRIIRNDIPAKALEGNKYLLLVSGPSGVGKDTVMNEIMHKFNKIVTHTTRAKRAGEVDGKSYFFTTVDKFIESIKNNEFAEYVNSFSGRYYGTKKETIKKALDGKKPALAIVDVDGARNIKNNLKDDSQINVVSIFFRPPSLDVLKDRLKGRGTETVEAIEERLRRSAYEIEQASMYDAEIQVNNLKESLDDMAELLHLNKLKV